MYITVEGPYNEGLGLTNYCNMKYKLTSLVITKIFCQSPSPSLYRGCTVLNFIYLFSEKWGRGCCPPQPLPLRPDMVAQSNPMETGNTG